MLTSMPDTDATQSYLVSLGEVSRAAREFVCSYQPSYLAVVTVTVSVHHIAVSIHVAVFLDVL